MQRQLAYQPELVENRERLLECFGDDKPLPLFIRSLVDLDRNAAMNAYGNFLDGSHYNSPQIRFTEMIIERLTKHVTIDPGQLYEPPFTAVHHEGLDGAFGDSDADGIVPMIVGINRAAAA